MKRFLSLIGLLVAFESTMAAPQPRLNVRVLKGQDFCFNLVKTFASSPLVSGSKEEQLQKSHQAARRLVTNIRGGNMGRMVALNDIGLENQGGGERELRRFISLDALLRAAMGDGKDYTLAFDANELRFIPHTLPNTHILLVVNSAGDLNPDRARIVAAIAQRNKISLSVIWYGPLTDQSGREATGMAFLTGLTGGTFVDLNAPSPCSPQVTES